MALINCAECGNQVSNIAATCPHCGAPVAAAAVEAKGAGAALTTVQETSKKLKLHIIIGSALFWLGLLWIFVAVKTDHPPGRIPLVVLLIGLVWYVVTRFRIWWHHK